MLVSCEINVKFICFVFAFMRIFVALIKTRMDLLEQNKLFIHNCDNMEFMAKIPDKFFELACVDPEYGLDIANSNDTKGGNGKANKKKYTKKDWDKSTPKNEYFSELFRVSKNQIIWGANYFGLIGGYIFWDKEVTMPTFSAGELAYCSLINKVDYIKIPWHGMIQHNMKNKEIRIHPTQKPIALYKWLLSKYAKQGDKIFDSHLGSMSSVIAAYEMGFEIHGCELDAEYFEAGKNRVITHLRQMKLF